MNKGSYFPNDDILIGYLEYAIRYLEQKQHFIDRNSYSF